MRLICSIHKNFARKAYIKANKLRKIKFRDKLRSLRKINLINSLGARLGNKISIFKTYDLRNLPLDTISLKLTEVKKGRFKQYKIPTYLAKLD